jgi:hypothetical protein
MELRCEGALFRPVQAAQVEAQGVVGDVADDGHGQSPQRLLQLVQHAGTLAARPRDEGDARQAVDRQRAGADLRERRRDGGVERPARQRRLPRRQQALGLGADLGFGARQQAQRRQPLRQALGVAIEAQRGLERGQRILSTRSARLSGFFACARSARGARR